MTCKECKYKDESVKIESIDLKTGDAVLECGCHIKIYIDRLVKVI